MRDDHGGGSSLLKRKSKSFLTVAAHEPGLCSILFDLDGRNILTAGADNQVKLFPIKLSSAPSGGDGAPSLGDPRTVRVEHKGPMTTLAMSPMGDKFATAAEDHTVKLHSYPAARFESNVTRFTLPIRALAFNVSGGLLAAAGDDEGIKVISTVDSSIVSVLKGHDAPVLSVAFDPKNELLASCDADGTVIIWSISEAKPLHTLRGVAPVIDAVATEEEADGAAAAVAGRSAVAWHPDGSFLAAPGTDCDVICYDRDTADVMLTLKGVHKSRVAVLAWCPSGRYLATAGAADGTVAAWDVEAADGSFDLDVCRVDAGAPITGLQWSPADNAIAAIDCAGCCGVWHGPVPPHMAAPNAAPQWGGAGIEQQKEARRTREELFRFDDAPGAAGGGSGNSGQAGGEGSGGAQEVWEDDLENDDGRRGKGKCGSRGGDGEGDAGAGSGGEEEREGGFRAHAGRRRGGGGARHVVEDGSDREDEVGGWDGEREEERKGGGKRDGGRGSGGKGHVSRGERKGSVAVAAPVVFMQPPFQPGSTTLTAAAGGSSAEGEEGVEGPGGVRLRYLAYDMLGRVTTRMDAESDTAHVEVDFHDTSAAVTRVPALTDYYGCTMGVLGERGYALASPARAKQPSTILFRPFTSWAPSSDWSVRLPAGEEVTAIAVGRKWVAAATSRNFLRIFSDTGLQRAIVSLEGPVVAMAGQGAFLAIAFLAAGPHPDGHQAMHLLLLDMHSSALRLRTPIALSPCASLAWLGFSTISSDPSAPLHTTVPTVATYDSQGVVRILSPDFGGCWMPIFSVSASPTSESHRLWMVGLDLREQAIFFIVCTTACPQPSVFPRPVLSEMPLALPLALSDLAAADSLQADLLRSALATAHVRAVADEALQMGEQGALAAAEDEEELLKLEAERDKTLLRLLVAAAKGDKLERAMELGTMLSLRKSLQGAVKLTSALRLPVLAERLHLLLQVSEWWSAVVRAAALAPMFVKKGPGASQKAAAGGQKNVKVNPKGSDAPAAGDCSSPQSAAKGTATDISARGEEAGAGDAGGAKPPASSVKPCNPFGKKPGGAVAASGVEGSVLDSVRHMQQAEGALKDVKSGDGAGPKRASVVSGARAVGAKRSKIK
ncbi:unnamed protein product [Closterium sp. Naga37s-1]|nr:unnamed protein product [Closterium sp. Naga37s-1]